MKTLALLVILVFTATTSLTTGEKEKFIGESIVNPCEIDIPLYYSTKGEEALMAAAKKYKDTEIVLVTNEKNGQANYKFYYIESYQGTYGPSAYLVSSENHNSPDVNRQEFFLEYKPKKHSFYDAKCFREKLDKNSSLSDNLKEKK